jgi:hypothetical protein
LVPGYVETPGPARKGWVGIPIMIPSAIGAALSHTLFRWDITFFLSFR